MILRTITLASGLTGAAVFSQFPEFSQQYVQRLGGAVDALGQVVDDFDNSASAEGLTRAQALDQMRGSEFVERRRVDMERTFVRHDALKADLQTMTRAGPFMRAYHAARVDRDVAKAAWDVFQPAVPLNFAGLVFAGFGFLIGSVSFGVMGRVCRACVGVIRGRKQA